MFKLWKCLILRYFPPASDVQQPRYTLRSLCAAFDVPLGEELCSQWVSLSLRGDALGAGSQVHGFRRFSFLLVL